MLKVECLLERLNENYLYTKEFGYEGMEPHVLSDTFFTKRAELKPTILNKIMRKAEVKLIEAFPCFLKPYLSFLKIQYKQKTPYAFGYFLQAYTNLYKITGNVDILENIKELDMLLTESIVATQSGLGVPYSSNNKGLVLGSIITNEHTANAPGGAECFWGYMMASKAFFNEEFNKKAMLIARGFYNDFALKSCTEGVCFDYSNHGDGTHILNASILIAVCILESGLDGDASEIVRGCYKYVRKYMVEFDELPYAGIEDQKLNKTWYSYDCYHTGFVLRSMYYIDKVLFNSNDKELILNKVKKMMKDFTFRGTVCMFKSEKYYDIHAFAEYVNTYSCFYDFFTIDEKINIENIIKHSFQLFTSKVDSRRYIYRKVGFSTIDEYMPLWGQGAMMNALSNLIIAKK